jgi:hypothetical protein
MTEYELVDAIASYTGLLHSWLMAYFTVFTAYVVAAYAVGRQLTNFQSFVVTTCFLVFNSLVVVATMGTGMRFIELTQQISIINPERTYLVSPEMIGTGGVVLSIGILVSLKFMWDVRHPRSE